MHRRPFRDRDADDDRDWRERRGRYAGLDPDTPDRPQVKPFPKPDDPMRLTHNRLGDESREPEGGDDSGTGKPWGPDDDS